MDNIAIWRALISEFLATFLLVFIGAGAASLSGAQGGSLIGTALAFGLAFIALFYIWSSSSGAHANPAISFGVALNEGITWGTMLGYWVAQILGGIAGAALVAWFFGTSTGAGASVGSLTYTEGWKALLVEATLTFFLVLTFLAVTTDTKYAIVAGIVVGAIIAADILAGGPLTGGSMNPARSVGPALFSGNMGSWWIYIFGPLLGALIAGLVYKCYNKGISWTVPKVPASAPAAGPNVAADLNRSGYTLVNPINTAIIPVQ